MAEADVCLRLVRCSGSAGAGSEVRYRQCVSTGQKTAGSGRNCRCASCAARPGPVLAMYFAGLLCSR
jgi:hypothetical protein